MRYTPSGIPVARFAIAVNRVWRGDAGGEKNQDVDFINIVAWRRLAEICGEYLKKGRPVAIEGRLQIRSFEGKTGEKKTMTEVVADGMQMLGKAPVAGRPAEPTGPETTVEGGAEADVGESEIPF